MLESDNIMENYTINSNIQNNPYEFNEDIYIYKYITA